MKSLIGWLICGVFALFHAQPYWGQATDRPAADRPAADRPAANRPTADRPAADRPRQLPDGRLGETIRLGRELVAKTTSHPLTKPYVGNALNCTSCHLKHGTDPKAASFLDVAAAYPAWSPREKRVITLEDRVLNCFMRSCNGVRPPLGSDVSVAIVAYITWLSTERPIRMNSQRPAGPHAVPQLKVAATQADRQRGAKLYASRCATCHGEDGQGEKENPPVWGAQSFNDGAGLANVAQLASWLKVAMPLDEANLTDQDALDVAVFVNSHKRPNFRLQEHLPPRDKLGTFNAESSGDAKAPLR